MRRWGQIPEAKSADWYPNTIKNIYRPDIWKKAASLLVAEGNIPARIGYINSFSIGNKDKK